MAYARPSLPEFHGKYLSLNYPCRQTNFQVISADLRRFSHLPHAALQFRDFFRADYLLHRLDKPNLPFAAAQNFGLRYGFDNSHRRRMHL